MNRINQLVGNAEVMVTLLDFSVLSFRFCLSSMLKMYFYFLIGMLSISVSLQYLEKFLVI
jgi:hypothetical protein